MISLDELRALATTLSSTKAIAYLPHCQDACTRFDITTRSREAAFLAQILHESGEFKWLREIWGPTPAQRKYEGKATLGNTELGDGKRFMGRGVIQITGRANYTKYGPLLGLDLISNPALAELPENAFAIAGAFWQTHGLNELADVGSFDKITKRINGGTNGKAARDAYYARARAILSDDGPLKPSFTIFVNGVDVTAKLDARLRDGRLLVPIRDFAKLAGLLIPVATGSSVTLRDHNGAETTVPIVLIEGHGYLTLKEIPGTLKWSEATHTATYTSPE
ncbi:MAG: glycoside hydrolase family 19 protein [bacterium]